MTLVEMLVALTVLGFLMTSMSWLYLAGARATHQARTRSELMQDLQVTAVRIVDAIDKSAADGLTVESSGIALSVLVAEDDNGIMGTDDEGNIVWTRYRIYYWDGDVIKEKEIPLAAGALEELAPGPIENYDAGGGTLALHDYLTDGRPIARNVTRFRVEKVGNLIQVEATAEKTRYGRSEPETYSISMAVAPRN